MGRESLQQLFASPETSILLKTPTSMGPAKRERTVAVPARAVMSSILFLDWMASRRTPATPQTIQDHFGVSRATSYRWLRTYADARGLVWPTKTEPVSLPPRAPAAPQYAGMPS